MLDLVIYKQELIERSWMSGWDERILQEKSTWKTPIFQEQIVGLGELMYEYSLLLREGK